MNMDDHWPERSLGIIWRSSNADIKAGGHIGSHNTCVGRDMNLTINQLGASGASICDEVADWLRSRSINYRRTHDETFSARTLNTGKWFFDCSQFKDWEEGRVENLACIGMPGAGKTSLASAVIEKLRDRIECLTMYIYCKHNSQSMQTLPIIFSNLLSQAVQKRTVISENVLKLYKEYKSGRLDILRLDLLTNVLKGEILQYQRTYIIFDALDECNVSSPELVKALESLGAQLIITSRWEIPFKIDTYLRVGVKAEGGDVGAYIWEQIQKTRLSKIVENDPSLSEEIVSRLGEKSHGMFLIPKLHIEVMKTQRTPQGIRDTMEKLPDDLDSIFEETLQRIRSQPNQLDVDIGMHALMWMRFAKKNLRTDELLHALAMYSLPGRRGSPKSHLPLRDDVLSACIGLVDIVEPEQGRPEFRFTHYSIQQFLEHHSSKYFGKAAEHEIAETCLHYLINSAKLVDKDVSNYLISTPLPAGSDWQSDEYEDYRKKNLFDAFPLCVYGGCYWADHSVDIGDGIDHALVCDFFRNPLSPYMYCQRYRERDYVTPVPFMDTQQYQILFLACFGLHTLMASCLPNARVGTDGRDLDAIQDASGWTPLYFAARQDSNSILCMLLERGANVDTPASDGTTPLCSAAGAGQYDHVQMLIQKGANLNPPQETPLCWAAEGGHEKIVRYLLDQGALVNLPDTDSSSRTPLHAAAEGKNHQVAALLLSKGAHPNPPGRNRGEPLAWAAYHGAQDTVQLLLDSGADPNQPDPKGKTPLQLVVDSNHSDVEKLLLLAVEGSKTGIDPPPACDTERTLCDAVQQGNIHLVKKILASDVGAAAIDRPDAAGEIPLRAAVFLKHYDIATLLLDKGADPNLLGDRRGVALAWAVHHGARKMVELLVEKGADINHRTMGLTPLQRAICRKESDIAGLLIIKGAKPTPPGKHWPSLSIRGAKDMSAERPFTTFMVIMPTTW